MDIISLIYSTGENIKYFYILLSSLFFFGCSSAKLEHSWQKTKDASYTAVSDPVTWGTALGAGVLYATYDDDISEHFAKHNLIDSEDDETLRALNGAMTYATALAIEDDEYKTKAKRVLFEWGGLVTAQQTTNLLNSYVKKENPSKNADNAIGSHHALEPFTASAMTRRNVDEINIPAWGKYTLNSVSYLSATGSALTRVQEGGHSFADQLVSASIGNFIGAFFYEALIRDDKNNIQSLEVSLNRDTFFIQTAWNF
ncbi:MAG: hypothetical protein U9Q29_00860 [Campylobacterota bacterium]|nr:hypothetical protein [Campylobacterota bacterium]